MMHEGTADRKLDLARLYGAGQKTIDKLRDQLGIEPHPDPERFRREYMDTFEPEQRVHPQRTIRVNIQTPPNPCAEIFLPKQVHDNLITETCPECDGTGSVELLTSVVPCSRGCGERK